MRLDRRRFIRNLGTVSGTAICSSLLAAEYSLDAVARQPDSASRPNILFIFSDDHAVQAISAYGSVINKTPNLDRIARDGILFRNNFCCNSICAPSRATVLTGKHSHANGVRTNKDRFDTSQITFPRLLQESGYQTALIGKWHLKVDPVGFDYWKVLPGQGHYYNPDFRTKEGKQHYKGYVTDIITDLSLEWIEKKRVPERPFLLMCQHKAPHRVWAPPLKYLTLYDDEEIPEPPTLFDDYSGRSPVVRKNEMEIRRHMMYDWDLKVPGLGIPDSLGRDFKNPEYPRMTPEQKKLWDAAYGPKNEDFKKRLPHMTEEELLRWKYQRYIKDYLRCIASVDENVGRILDYLDQNNLAENTLVVYSSDQGFYLGEHGWYDKRWMYEESLRMPLMMRWPGGVVPGTEVEKLTQNIDFAPTFLNVSQVPIPDEMQGRSLVPFFDGVPPGDWRKAIYYHYYEQGEHHVPQHEGVRTRRYKLIHYYADGEWELFDLEKDPHELHSVYEDPAYSEIRRWLKEQLDQLKREYAVPPDS